MLTVFGVKNAKDFKEASKLKNFFVVGSYHTTDFEPEDVMSMYKEQKKGNAIALGTLILAGLAALGMFFGSVRVLEKKPEMVKEVPQKFIQAKDSIADTLKNVGNIKF